MLVTSPARQGDRTPAPVSGAIPTYDYRCAPDGLATLRQLRAAGLRPGGHDPVAQVYGPRRTWAAALYRIDLAKPVRPMTPGRWRAHDAMMRARRTCPECSTERWYVIPTRYGCCTECVPDAA
jgi:hypothetical protein